MNNHRIKKIIALLSSGEYISSEYISVKMGVSPRTVFTDLNELQTILAKHGAVLERKSHYGNRILVQDKKAFDRYCQEVFALEQPARFDDSEERIQYILQRFLNEKEYLHMEELCEEIGISQTALSLDLKQIRFILRRYHLDLKVRPHYGMQITGTEFHKRLCINGIIIKHIDQKDPLSLSNALDSEKKDTINQISRIIETVLHEEHIRMSYVAMQYLTIFLLIMQERVQNGFLIQENPADSAQNLSDDEKHAAKRILDLLGTSADCRYLEEEILTLALFISAYRIVRQEELDDGRKCVTAENTSLCRRILISIRDDLGCDFTHDAELIHALELHMISLFSRRQYGFTITNPMLKEMKTRDLMGYIYGMKAAALINNPPISEDEIGYLAQHFILALERRNMEEGKKRILMVSGTGDGTEKLLAYRMKKIFGNYIAALESCDIMQLPFQDMNRYDCAITTVPLYTELPLPVKKINFFMENEDFNTIRRFLTSLHRNSMKDYIDPECFFRDEDGDLPDILDRMEARMNKKCHNWHPDLHHHIPDTEMIISADTEYPVMIVHPLKSYADRTYLFVATSKKAILCDGKKISMILMIIPQKKVDRKLMVFYKLISLLLHNPVALRQVIKTQSYDTLMEWFERIETSIRETAEIL